MSYSSHRYRPFAKLLKQHGMVIRPLHGGHLGIFKDGQRVYTFAGSPKSVHQVVDNNIKDLINCGHLPAGITYNGRVYKRRETNG